MFYQLTQLGKLNPFSAFGRSPEVYLKCPFETNTFSLSLFEQKCIFKGGDSSLLFPAPSESPGFPHW